MVTNTVRQHLSGSCPAYRGGAVVIACRLGGSGVVDGGGKPSAVVLAAQATDPNARAYLRRHGKK